MQLEVGRYSQGQSINWTQFLDFFFSRGGGADEWWKRVDAEGADSVAAKKKSDGSALSKQPAAASSERRFGSSKTYNPTSQAIGGGRSKGWEQSSRTDARGSSPGRGRANDEEDGGVLLTEEADLEREDEGAAASSKKPQSMLRPEHVQVMRDIFSEMDSHGDMIL